ncbi:MAG TPA: molecular chaperone TorD family protein [Syntrophomonadaceae bacterium]|nr:molecular chaperone TorD family protein [Syntrophomonadaceae bacterium]
MVLKILDLKLDELLATKDLSSDIYQGIKKIKSFCSTGKIKMLDRISLELNIDRTQLLRGLDPEKGPRPPYESVFLGLAPQQVLVELAKAYGSANYGLGEGVTESPEQIGIQLSFMQNLCGKEALILENSGDQEEWKSILSVQKNFLNQHLGKWYSFYADEMLKFAKTEFYQGIALFLKGFVGNDIGYLAEITL